MVPVCSRHGSMHKLSLHALCTARASSATHAASSSSSTQHRGQQQNRQSAKKPAAVGSCGLLETLRSYGWHDSMQNLAAAPRDDTSSAPQVSASCPANTPALAMDVPGSSSGLSGCGMHLL